jgi:DnaK suppressor protein
MLTAVQLRQLNSALVERERLLRGEVRKVVQEKLGRDIPELESMGDESARSVADLLDDVDTGMMVRDVDELMTIEAARRAMAQGSYGKCVDCGDPVGFRRLIALPSAARCLPCQEKHEHVRWHQPQMKL